MKLSVLTYMAWGAGVTVMLAAAVILLSSVLGMGLALTRLYAWPPLRALAAGYALTTRGIPLLVLLIGCYFRAAISACLISASRCRSMPPPSW